MSALGPQSPETWVALRAVWDDRDDRYSLAKVKPGRASIEAARVYRRGEASRLTDPRERELALEYLEKWHPL